VQPQKRVVVPVHRQGSAHDSLEQSMVAKGEVNCSPGQSSRGPTPLYQQTNSEEILSQVGNLITCLRSETESPREELHHPREG
jgi:hypothetical protein